MKQQSTGRVLVTGAQGELGVHLVQAYKDAGWSVVQHARSGSDINGDLAAPTTVDQIASFVKTGQLHCIVFNASHLGRGRLCEYEDNDITDLVQSNVTAIALFAIRVSKVHLAQPIHLILVSSIAVMTEYSPNSLYALSKQAQEKALIGLAEENRLVRLSIVRPGPFGQTALLDPYYAARPSLVSSTESIAQHVVDLSSRKVAGQVSTIGWRYKILLFLESWLPRRIWKYATILANRNRDT
ncbi:NAD(P)-dependent oxidoreductase [Candidatus Nomurabacteria bacterium]|nr:NAD(P)-dependent oxidoreductase [Candidatus Nomurabacteria bacterium]